MERSSITSTFLGVYEQLLTLMTVGTKHRLGVSDKMLTLGRGVGGELAPSASIE